MGDVGIADLLIARRALGLGRRSTQLVASMCGLSLASPEQTPVVLHQGPTNVATTAQPPSALGRTTERASMTSPPRSPERSAVRSLSPSRIEPWSPDRSVPRYADPLPSRSSTPWRPSQYDPLFDRPTSRDVLDILAATPRPTNRIAIGRLVADLVRLRPITQIPHHNAPSFAAGLAVLLDVGEGMQPFRRDQQQVVAALRQLVGPAITVLHYIGTPWEGVREDSSPDWQRWRLPPVGRPVIVLGTLGGGIRPDAGAVVGWLRAIEILWHRGSRLTALVPVPSSRWNPRLRHTGALLLWDRSTRTRHARSLHDKSVDVVR